jgi:hypothetical protein
MVVWGLYHCDILKFYHCRDGATDPDLSGCWCLLGPGGILDTLYGLENLVRIDDDVDQWWINRDGAATARARFAGSTQTLGFIDASQVLQPLFTETGDGFAVSGTGTLPHEDALPIFRWGLQPSGAPQWSSHPRDNTDRADHMVTWLIADGPGTGNLVIAWEDLSGLGDRDYQDLIVELSHVTPAQVVNDLVSLDPAVQTVFDPKPVPHAPAGTFTITATFTNNSTLPITHPFFEVIELSGRNVLLNADGGAQGAGATLTPDSRTNAWASGGPMTVDFVIGLQVRKPFTFFIDLLGAPMP